MRYVDNQPTKECYECASEICRKCECDIYNKLDIQFYVIWVLVYLLLVVSVILGVYWYTQKIRWEKHCHDSAMYMGNLINNTNETVVVRWYFNCDEYRSLQWFESHLESRYAVTNVVNIHTDKERPLTPDDKVEWSIPNGP